MGAAPQQRRPCSLVAISAFLLMMVISLAPTATAFSFFVTSAGHLRKCREIPLPSPAAGPESVAFDGAGGGPYTGVSDGRVLRWRPETHLWEEFAVPPRRQYRSSWCDGYQNGSQQENVCGRPLGLQFHRATGDLYIADAYFGLLVVGPAGGVAAQVATAADGEPFRFTNGVDVDQENGVVYFTDSSTRFRRRDFLLCVITGDATGRLLRYDPKTRSVTVLLKGLAFPNGVAVSRDGAFLLVAETSRCRVLRYWLRGARAGAPAEVFAELPGYPDNIKWNPGGELWAGINMGALGDMMKGGAVPCPVAARVGADGRVVEVVNDCGSVGAVSEVEERNGTLWFGSVERPSLEAYAR